MKNNNDFIKRSIALGEKKRLKNRAKRRRQGRGGYNETQIQFKFEYGPEEVDAILKELLNEAELENLI